jgi:cystathionine beta-lyase/cystathionine gamma-synthase
MNAGKRRNTLPDPRHLSLSTRAIHGPDLRPFRGPVAPPIVQTSTFRFADSGDAVLYAQGDPDVFVYTRYHNPTVQQAQDRLALVMNSEKALLFSSGMAAITAAIFTGARAGDNILSTPSLYGGTYRLFRDVLPDHGIGVRYIPADALETIPALATRRTRIVYCETPTNPTLRIVDLRRLVAAVRAAEKRHRSRILVVCDNTFASAVNQNPIALGVDVVLESTTKYLGGHSDVVGGVLAGSAQFIRRAHTQLKYLGGCADPFAAFLLLRSLKTFALRVERQNENALELARFLERHPKVARVLYPGLPSHPDHATAAGQMTEAGGKGFGGMITIELRGGLRAAVRLCDRLRIAVNAMSLGGVETLVSIPVYSSHIAMAPRELARHGVTRGMVRISTGVEDFLDLRRDFARALDTL